MNKLLELDSKMILIACVETSPGFSTVHLAQERLGLAVRTPLSGLAGAWYIDPVGDRKWFSRKDVPGCSQGFGKLYSNYLMAGMLNVGRVGNANSVWIRCRDAIELESSILQRNPRAVLCDDHGCISCASRFFNKRAWPTFVARALTGRASL
jgi:aminoglycoside N3'-acetyltransferase